MTELLTKDQAAQLLTVSVVTLDRLIRQGLIPVYRISPKVTRLDRADVLVYLESRRQRAAGVATRKRHLMEALEALRSKGFKLYELAEAGEGLSISDVMDALEKKPMAPRKIQALEKACKKLEEENGD